MVSFNSIRELLVNLKPELISRFHVNSIGLFGSVVRSDFSAASSDVDIVVDFSSPIGIEFIDLADFLESKIKRKVDLVSRAGMKDKFYQEIEREIVYV